LSGVLPASIQKALAIDPAPGSTYLDAEHVVILMQENRSFDHAYGSLQGVRGFNDPRALTLANKNPIWLQTNAEGETYAPFRLNIKESKATWMGSLPHSWGDQVEARNQGRNDRWLDAKRSGHGEYARLPLTMGYYNRDDIPFYYALADAFTVCDQNFCSSLTGTTPNRLYLWTGTIREEPKESSHAKVWNSDVDYGSNARWTTFPERLEANGISWKIYQNELSLSTGFTRDEDNWLANFTDNPIEWFEQYNVGFLPTHREHLQRQLAALPGEIKALEERVATTTGPALDRLQKQLANKRAQLIQAEEGVVKWSRENFEKLSASAKNLHSKAFSTNTGDPNYRQLATLEYREGETARKVKVPKGDVLHQFRADVKTGKLPTVSWIVAPSNFSDHPGSPWYGAWYVSEVMDILTSNPEVWKKTIFILAYDENDGYFDHIAPFVPPHPRQPETGMVSKGIDASVEHVVDPSVARKGTDGSPIGLGFRVPLVIASPWSRGGQVCSQVFDHTSVLQFLEKLLSHKTGKPLSETNISAWRRTVCGDLTSSFQTYNGEKIGLPTFLGKEATVEGIHRAQFKGLPDGFKRLSGAELEQVKEAGAKSPLLPKQEPGVRPACPLPYQLYTEGRLSPDKSSFEVVFEAGKEVFGAKSAGSPFQAYTLAKFRPLALGSVFADQTNRDYAVAPGDELTDAWAIDRFENGLYRLAIHGPNGFFREFQGDAFDPLLEVRCEYERVKGASPALTGNVVLLLGNLDSGTAHNVEIQDRSYGAAPRTQKVSAGAMATVVLDLSRNFGWYDFSLKVAGHGRFEKRYAGHVETGMTSRTDPAMGRVVG
jgi:phospholipase C